MSVNTTALLALEYSISRIDQASLDVIAQLTGAVFNLSTELYYVDCSKTANMPDIFFKMGSFEYFLSSEFYTRQVSAHECVLMFAGNNLSYVNTVWLLVAIVAIAASSVLMIVILCGIVLFVFLRRKIMNQRIVTATPGTRYYYFKRFLSTKTGAHGEVYDEHELRPTDIRITDVLLGEGAYGKVYKGTLIASRRNVAGKAALATELTDEVAAKVLHSHASDQTRVEFRREIDLLKELSHHPHILNIVGCITLTPELVLVAEFCANGDLNATLRRHRACILLVRLRRSLQYCAELKESDVCDVGEDVCMVRKSLVSFAWQVSDGMVFLASKKLVHRDLAARNVLLTSKMVAKIADFGMCLRVEEAAVTESNKVPVRWTAPEALRSGQFSVASDV
ncbi:Protein F09A5.2 [Aphelenchoides avenae]|nr:Protein F09A5.2 [Aphelenchus avenae]